MINFQYIYQLPKSRWGATKKQMVSVPVSPETVMQTVSQLPRLPKDAGLIPVNLKRKMEYDRSHKKEMIDPDKIERAMNVLKTSGHPYYQFCDDFNIDAYKKRCKDEDEAGYKLLFDEENSSRSDKSNDKEGQVLKNEDDDISDDKGHADNDPVTWTFEADKDVKMKFDLESDPMIIEILKSDGTGFRVIYHDDEDSGDDDEIIEILSEIPEESTKEDISDEVLTLLSKIELDPYHKHIKDSTGQFIN